MRRADLIEGFRALRRRYLRLAAAGFGSTTARADIRPYETDAQFVMTLYETLLERGASVGEFAEWRDRLTRGAVRRRDVLWTFYQSRAGEAAGEAERLRHPYPIMGTDLAVNKEDWRETSADSRRLARPTRFEARFPAPRADGTPIASIITSLYKGEAYIKRFLEMMTSQTIFQQCELIIVDANSPEGEAATIAKYCEQFPQIVYVRLPYTITIYAAWNLAVQLARGRYLTNANVDDLRRRDSIELQAAALDALDFVDVIYQDFVYTFEEGMAFDEAASLDLRSDLPLATRLSFAAYNPPHNAPMWRRGLHDDVGYFDDSLRSGGDWDFWMRCLIAKKQFLKLNDPHVGYYVNPAGISTAASSVGGREAREVHRRHWRRLMPQAVVEDHSAFALRCGLPSTTPVWPTKLRYAKVQELFREIALKSERPRATAAELPRPLNVLVDGVVFQTAVSVANLGAAWQEILATLARGANVTVLDRGNTPAIEGVDSIPFPSYRGRAKAADSLLIERFCRLVKADVFLSTGWTTSTGTPSVVLLAAADWENGDPLERELSVLFARHRVCGGEDVLGRVRVACPGLEPSSLSVLAWERDPGRAAAHLIHVLGDVDEHARKGDDAPFFAQWAKLRGIQADVDYF